MRSGGIPGIPSPGGQVGRKHGTAGRQDRGDGAE